MLAPLPKIDIAIRPGTMEDVPFLDSLQKLHTKQVGWMPTKQFEGKIDAGHLLIAEVDSGKLIVDSNASAPSTNNYQPSTTPVGYLIGNDQYFKRDDVGIIYQINVAPVKQRGFIGASLLQAQFERSAYGCRLYCCWCAQDIAANRFWEAMGFIPLAFRAGSAKKARVHIFWQKRIRQDDHSTPWWYPAKTDAGAIREDRIVLPIPPGTHWSEVHAVAHPVSEAPKQIADKTPISRPKKPAAKTEPDTIAAGGPRFGNPKSAITKSKAEPRQKVKADPKMISAARELRDRYLEQVNERGYSLESVAKYDVSRMIAEVPAQKLLAA